MPDVAAEFLVTAHAFRAALAGDAADDKPFAREVRDALAGVYAAAALLGPPTTAEGEDSPDRQPGEYSALRDRLAARFGAHDVFVGVYDPSRLVDENTRPYERSLSSELAEIDEDLAEAIAWLEERGGDALWDVRWAFENHWGQHALACLRPLHQLATYSID